MYKVILIYIIFIQIYIFNFFFNIIHLSNSQLSMLCILIIMFQDYLYFVYYSICYKIVYTLWTIYYVTLIVFFHHLDMVKFAEAEKRGRGGDIGSASGGGGNRPFMMMDRQKINRALFEGLKERIMRDRRRKQEGKHVKIMDSLLLFLLSVIYL